jgi:hypothetical protein
MPRRAGALADREGEGRDHRVHRRIEPHELGQTPGLQRSPHRVALDADDMQLHLARHRLLAQHEQDRQTLRTQGTHLAQVQDDVRHPEHRSTEGPPVRVAPR